MSEKDYAEIAKDLTVAIINNASNIEDVKSYAEDVYLAMYNVVRYKERLNSSKKWL